MRGTSFPSQDVLRQCLSSPAGEPGDIQMSKPNLRAITSESQGGIFFFSLSQVITTWGPGRDTLFPRVTSVSPSGRISCITELQGLTPEGLLHGREVSVPHIWALIKSCLYGSTVVSYICVLSNQPAPNSLGTGLLPLSFLAPDPEDDSNW